ncbi:TRAP transporter substrate-binding protein [Pantoea vagans]|uniref:TRAP transporter substrate-binding protein n=1 Tax=Pantoea vagans TaxID=470934 RepID=UPI003015D1F6
MSFNRRKFLKASAASLIALPLAGTFSKAFAASNYTLKIGNSFPGAHPLNIRLKQAAEQVEQKTGGKMKVRIFADSALGSDSDMMSQVRSGALDAVCTSLLFFESLEPSANIAGLGFGYKDYNTVWSAWDGDVGHYVRGRLSKLGITPLEKTWDNGFRQITNNVHPINTVADLQGMKIRVPSARIQQDLFVSLGAAPTSVNIKETYSALKTHVVDGQENALTHAEFWKFYEVQKYCSMTSHMWDGLTVVCNSDIYNGIPDELRNVFNQTFNDTALLQRQDMVNLNTSLRESLSKKGMVFNDIDKAPFRQKLTDAGFYKKWRGIVGEEVWALYEKYVNA